MAKDEEDSALETLGEFQMSPVYRTTALAVMAGLMATSALADERVMRIATSVPDQHYLTVSIAKFAEKVTERTDGRIKFEIYPAQSLATDQQMEQAVASGMADIGIASASIVAGTVPAFNIFAVPFLFDTREKLEKTVKSGAPLRTELEKGLADTGARPVFWIPYGYIGMVSRTKEVRLPQDVKGMKMRTFGSIVSQFVEEVGAAPVVTSGGEQFLALQQGMVDAGFTGWFSIQDRQLYDVAKYAINTDHMWETHFALMSESNWQSLSEDDRRIFSEVGAELEPLLMDEVFNSQQNLYETLADKMTVIQLTEEEKDAWRNAAPQVAEKFLKDGDNLSRAVYELTKDAQ